MNTFPTVRELHMHSFQYHEALGENTAESMKELINILNLKTESPNSTNIHFNSKVTLSSPYVLKANLSTRLGHERLTGDLGF